MFFSEEKPEIDPDPVLFASISICITAKSSVLLLFSLSDLGCESDRAMTELR